MTGIELWSTTAASNNSASPNGWPEGMPPSGVNDSARQMMAATRAWYETAEWINFGHTPTYIGATQFSVPTDLTTTYQVGRRVKAYGTTPFTIYGTITVSAYASVTTVTVVWDSGSLNGTLTTIWVGLASVTNPSLTTSAISGSFAPLIDSTAIIKGSSDATKLFKIEVDGFTTGTTRTATPPNKDGVMAYISDVVNTNDFRLTLTSGLPVTTADVTGATTIYCTPYKGNKIALYDGTNWNFRTSAEFSLALGTLTSGKPYDVFCYDNAGTPTLEFLVWTDDTNRATALVYQDGVLCKTGALTRRYLGSFYTTSTTQTEDSVANRYLYNYTHRQRRHMKRNDATASWNYTLAAYQQANASTANQVNAIQGVAEDEVQINVRASFRNTSAAVNAAVGIGIDSTTVNSAISCGHQSIVSNLIQPADAAYRGIPAAGRHSYKWLEQSDATGTSTWLGTNSQYLSGINGSVMA